MGQFTAGRLEEWKDGRLEWTADDGRLTMVGGEMAGGWPKTRRDRRPDLFWNNSEQTSFNSADFLLWDRHLRQKMGA